MKKVISAFRLFSRVLRGEEYARYALAEMITQRLYPRYRFSDIGRLYLHDDAFVALYQRLEPENDHSLDRKYLLDQMTRQALKVRGDTVECGAYRGASSYLICRRIAESGAGRQHHVFDSFEGLSRPGAQDGSHWKTGALAAPLDEVRATLREFEFVRYHPGWIPERFAEVSKRRFCLVHIDVDLYQPTLDSVAYFYPRMTSGGIIICDDYGFTTCPGATQAVDSFFADKPEPVLMLPTGQGMIIKQ